MLAKEGFGGTIARGIDNVGKFISDIPGKISNLFHKKTEQQNMNQQDTQDIADDLEEAFEDNLEKVFEDKQFIDL